MTFYLREHECNKLSQYARICGFLNLPYLIKYVGMIRLDHLGGHQNPTYIVPSPFFHFLPSIQTQ